MLSRGAILIPALTVLDSRDPAWRGRPDHDLYLVELHAPAQDLAGLMPILETALRSHARGLPDTSGRGVYPTRHTSRRASAIGTVQILSAATPAARRADIDELHVRLSTLGVGIRMLPLITLETTAGTPHPRQKTKPIGPDTVERHLDRAVASIRAALPRYLERDLACGGLISLQASLMADLFERDPIEVGIVASLMCDRRHRKPEIVIDIVDRFLGLLPPADLTRAGQALVRDSWLDHFGAVSSPGPFRARGTHHEAVTGRKLRTLEPTLAGLFPYLTDEPRLMYVLPQ